MEAAVVSMALKVVGNKLAPLLIKEYTSIVGVKRDLEELRDQVEEINGWLETRYEAVGNEPSFNWLKRLKDVAYAVDDVVDEFQLKAEKNGAAAADGGIVSKYTCTKPKSFISQCKMASKIKKIKRRFSEIAKQRTDYNAIINSIPVDPPVWQTNMRTGGTSSWPDVDVSSVVGRDEDKKHIISKLLETDHQLKIKIISVIGLGGSGKTTLSKLVFSDGNIKKHFGFTLWVHVSPKFDVSELVQKMFEAFADNNPGKHDMPSMRKTIADKLAGRRFLLVLDDVWTESQLQWEEFGEFLMNIGAPGSRILLTARSIKVAETVGSTDQFLLPLLSEASSWQLFIESCRMAANDLDSEFHDVGKQIVDKCGGVPLAIKVLAGVLRGKGQIDDWKAMRDNNLLYVEGKEHRVAACLRLSYFLMPSNLKQCFTICSVFPKGHKIDKEQLIDLWIAHDMISMDYIGNEHFNSLVQISFLQSVEEEDGRVTCRMHDLVYDLAQLILGDEIALVMPMEEENSTRSCRYFSLREQPQVIVPKNSFRKARGIYITKCHDYAHIFGKALENAKHLRSVTTIGTPYEMELAEAVFRIKYLKYLCMTRVYCEELPDAISDVRSLQALHITDSRYLRSLSESIGKLKRLRTLNLSGCRNLKSLPDSIGDCHMISNIDLWHCKELTVLPNSIGRNKELRVLRLGCTKLRRLPSMATLENLQCLDLRLCDRLVALPEGIENLKKLEVLNLEGSLVSRSLLALKEQQFDQVQHLKISVGRGEDFFWISELLAKRMIDSDAFDQCIKDRFYCKKSAPISELANIISRGDPVLNTYVLEDDVHKTCLKQKTNLQGLKLKWMGQNTVEVNNEFVQGVLDDLEPPLGIKELKICKYSGRQYARWMQNQVGDGVNGPAPFPFLRVMWLCDFPNLKHLDGLVELPCLEELVLLRMRSLESISGGPYPKLVKLEMDDLPCLGEVRMVAERTMLDEEDGGCCCNFTPQLGQVILVGNCLTELNISDCPKLEVKPHLPPSVQHLYLWSSGQLLQSPGQCQGSPSSPSFNHLKKLQLCNMTGLLYKKKERKKTTFVVAFPRYSAREAKVPESLWSLTSLQSLKLHGWSNIRMVPESIGELRSLQELTIESCDSLSSLPQTIGQLTSLQLLVIKSCKALQQLPDCLGGLCSLCKLKIKDLRDLTCLPESICHLTTSLQKLKIIDCPSLTSLPQGIEGLISLEKLSIGESVGLTSLPQGIKGLIALKELRISGCPGLVRRCKEGTGEDWHLISHIPSLVIRL